AGHAGHGHHHGHAAHEPPADWQESYRRAYDAAQPDPGRSVMSGSAMAKRLQCRPWPGPGAHPTMSREAYPGRPTTNVAPPGSVSCNRVFTRRAGPARPLPTPSLPRRCSVKRSLMLLAAVGLAAPAPVVAQAALLAEYPIERGGRTRDPYVAPDGKVWFV